ncbi:MAG: TlpA family protein disulfide reductase [Proteobacteria bacterium]|nr:TlpA family protein disulfide reductase [Pseudomonadota bacterium]
MTDTYRDPADKKPSLTNRLLIVFLVIVVFWVASDLWQSRLLPEGSDAPQWNLPWVDGASQTLSLSSLKGQVVVLNFWSTTCSYCREEVVELQAIWRRMKPLGVFVVGISTGGESFSQIRAFADKMGVDYPLLAGSGSSAVDYQIHSIPTTYVIDQNGKIVAAHRGFWDRDSIQKAVDNALK